MSTEEFLQGGFVRPDGQQNGMGTQPHPQPRPPAPPGGFPPRPPQVQAGAIPVHNQNMPQPPRQPGGPSGHQNVPQPPRPPPPPQQQQQQYYPGHGAQALHNHHHAGGTVPTAQHRGSPPRPAPLNMSTAAAVTEQRFPVRETRDLRDEIRTPEDCREALTDYTVFRFEKVADEDRYDAEGERLEESTWLNSRRSLVSMTRREKLREVRRLSRPPAESLAQKRRRLSPDQLMQVEDKLEELQQAEPDPGRYEVTLAQLDEERRELTEKEYERYFRKHGRRASAGGQGRTKKKKKAKRVSITAFYKRCPRPEANVELMLKEREEAEYLMSQPSQRLPKQKVPQAPPLVHQQARPNAVDSRVYLQTNDPQTAQVQGQHTQPQRQAQGHHPPNQGQPYRGPAPPHPGNAPMQPPHPQRQPQQQQQQPQQQQQQQPQHPQHQQPPQVPFYPDPSRPSGNNNPPPPPPPPQQHQMPYPGPPPRDGNGKAQQSRPGGGGAGGGRGKKLADNHRRDDRHDNHHHNRQDHHNHHHRDHRRHQSVPSTVDSRSGSGRSSYDGEYDGGYESSEATSQSMSCISSSGEGSSDNEDRRHPRRRPPPQPPLGRRGSSRAAAADRRKYHHGKSESRGSIHVAYGQFPADRHGGGGGGGGGHRAQAPVHQPAVVFVSHPAPQPQPQPQQQQQQPQQQQQQQYPAPQYVHDNVRLQHQQPMGAPMAPAPPVSGPAPVIMQQAPPPVPAGMVPVEDVDEAFHQGRALGWREHTLEQLDTTMAAASAAAAAAARRSQKYYHAGSSPSSATTGGSFGGGDRRPARHSIEVAERSIDRRKLNAIEQELQELRLGLQQRESHHSDRRFHERGRYGGGGGGGGRRFGDDDDETDDDGPERQLLMQLQAEKEKIRRLELQVELERMRQDDRRPPRTDRRDSFTRTYMGDGGGSRETSPARGVGGNPFFPRSGTRRSGMANHDGYWI